MLKPILIAGNSLSEGAFAAQLETSLTPVHGTRRPETNPAQPSDPMSMKQAKPLSID
jgi:hypothetical protein